MKSFSQITFDFNNAPAPEEQGVKIRVKSIKQSNEIPVVAGPAKKAKRGRRPLGNWNWKPRTYASPKTRYFFKNNIIPLVKWRKCFA